MTATHSMKMKILNAGIISKENYVKRIIAISKGSYTPRKDEPKIWFESLHSMTQVLSIGNQNLLKLIIEYKPKSLSELANLSGTPITNLTKTIKTLEKYGIVQLSKKAGMLAPKVLATDFTVQFGLRYGDPVQDGTALN